MVLRIRINVDLDYWICMYIEDPKVHCRIYKSLRLDPITDQTSNSTSPHDAAFVGFEVLTAVIIKVAIFWG
jgi:hypothetical protein